MKIGTGEEPKLTVHDLRVGDIFRFVNGSETQMYQINCEDGYQCLKTGNTYNTDAAASTAVLHYPNVELTLGEPSTERVEP